MTEVPDAIKDQIADWLKANARGRENAKPRWMLKNHVILDLHFLLADRTLRRIYKSLGHVGYACHDPKGIYWIDDLADFRQFEGEQRAKAISIFTRTKETQVAVEGGQQLELPR